jgi:fumarate reductase subunit D
MKELLLRLEPVIWTIFGGGIMVGTMLLTGWVLVFGILAPMGVVPAEALAFDRAYGLASHFIGRVVLAALIVLPLWKGAHHVRSISNDFGGAERDTSVATLLYAIAAAGSVLAIVAVVRL